MKAQCPLCHQAIEGDLEQLQSHIRACDKKSKPKATKPRKTRGQSFLPAVTRIPDLPYEIFVPREIPSQNLFKASHHWVYAKEAKEWKACLEPLLKDLLGLQLQWSKWRVTRLLRGRAREYDYGNMVGGCKPLLDALVYWSVAIDDAPKFMKVEYEQLRVLDDIPIEGETVIALLEATK